MSASTPTFNLPAQIADAISGIPGALIPACIKALDRLVGASVDIPAAWLAQKKAKIDAQTSAYVAVEAAIADAVASEAGATSEIVQQALTILVRKGYRKQENIKAVSVAAIEDLRSELNPENNAQAYASPQIDDDWLNVFERYAEDASTERMQNLWGRVLAGEIRRPGKFAMRTMCFLSEFSQADAMSFSAFANCTFGDIAPNKALIHPGDKKDIRDLMAMEAPGLIQGASGVGLTHTLTIGEDGYAVLREGILSIVFFGEQNTKIANGVVALTPLGVELLALLPERDPVASARLVASHFRSPQITSAIIGVIPTRVEVDSRGVFPS